ncbi:HAD family hydrolase [Virgibacillus sp. W0181]|uniref:HAD family hydrolase n=1 Tax=Virgibacillus sp. W0181 TaxID=3391581 RepID=UPI003F488066
MRVAIFDFDGTLYKKETFKILMDHLKHHPVYHARYKHFYRAMVPMYICYKLKLYPESKMKARSMQLYISALQHLSETELDTYFAELASKMVDNFNDDVIKRLKQHNYDGVHVMLVSGAYTQLLQAVKDQMGFHFDTIIGTKIPLKDGEVDQKAPIYHVQGERKKEKVRETLNNKSIDWEDSFAYGDSLSDLSVLELVGNPVAVQAEPKLLSVAKEKGWEII